MNLRDIKYLVSVAELGHFGRAAEACHVSQPTLSMQIKKLEETLGVTLFERHNRRVMLTDVGREILVKAGIVLEASEQMLSIAKHASDPMAGEVTIGVFPTLSPYLTPLFMPSIHEAFPKLRLRLIEEKTDELIARLSTGQIDCALLALPITHPTIEHQLLFEEPFVLASSSRHPLAKRKSISLDELSSLDVLLLDEGHCLRAQALDVCHRIGVQESANFRATSLETLREMVAHSQSVTLMPKLAIHAERSDMAYIPFYSAAPARAIALCWRKTTTRLALMQQLATLIAKAAKPYL